MFVRAVDPGGTDRLAWQYALRWTVLFVGFFYLPHAQAMQPKPKVQELPLVLVSVEPLCFLVERLSSQTFRCESFVGPGFEPDFFEPKPSDILRLAKADLYLSVGLAFEDKFERNYTKLNPQGIWQDIGNQPEDDKHTIGHNHQHHQHDHGDPHIWVSLKHLARMTPVIAERLIEVGAEAQQVKIERARLLVDMGELDERILDRLAPHKGKSIWVVHGSWHHFAKDYGLVQRSIEEHGKEQSPSALSSLLAQAQKQAVQRIFVQPQFRSQLLASMIERIGAQAVQVDPNQRLILDQLDKFSVLVAEALAVQK